MSLAIQPFDPSMLPDAARLVAARHREARRSVAALPPAFADEQQARAVIEEGLRETGSHSLSVAAVDKAGLAGFLLWGMPLPDPRSFLGIYVSSHTARVGYGGWATGEGRTFDAVRAMYAAAAGNLIRRGSLHHVVNVGVHELDALRAWRSLGFGRRLAVALRDTSPVQARSGAGFTVRRAGISDLDTLVQMVSDNDRHHATTPIFEPFMPETPSVHRQVLTELLHTPSSSAWIAEDGSGRCLGIHTYSLAPPAMHTPERCVYLEDGYTVPDARGLGVGTALLAAGMDWARQEGHRWCAISWNTDNLSGARFWQGHGFRPVLYRLRRSVDPRFNWAASAGPAAP